MSIDLEMWVYLCFNPLPPPLPILSQYFFFGQVNEGSPPLISIETVKLASSQRRFYFDVHKVFWKLGRGKFALGG